MCEVEVEVSVATDRNVHGRTGKEVGIDASLDSRLETKQTNKQLTEDVCRLSSCPRPGRPRPRT